MNRKNVIEQAVNRFLCWRLPDDFAPDCGISFDRSGHKYEPVGTNLLTAEQAKQMFLHCLPSYPAPVWTEEVDDMGNSTWEADSPYEDGGVPFRWRLKPRIGDNQIEWYECHDPELMNMDEIGGWPTLEEAREAIAEKHAEIAKAEGLSA